jgi:RNA polymerase sigma factor (sigma-70 family)
MKAQSAEFFRKGGKPMTDAEIIRQMELSPENGCRVLFDEYHGYVYTIVYHILRNIGSPRDIEECVTDVLSDVMVSYDIKHGGSLKAYIGSAARRRAIDVSRSICRKTEKNVPIDDESIGELASAVNVEKTVENSQLAKIVLQKIEEMGSPDAEILIQKYFYGRKSSETAKILKMNPITVRSRCSRAVKRLKKALADLDITL